jgi:hypothetical protein
MTADGTLDGVDRGGGDSARRLLDAAFCGAPQFSRTVSLADAVEAGEIT